MALNGYKPAVGAVAVIDRRSPVTLMSRIQKKLPKLWDVVQFDDVRHPIQIALDTGDPIGVHDCMHNKTFSRKVELKHVVQSRNRLPSPTYSPNNVLAFIGDWVRTPIPFKDQNSSSLMTCETLGNSKGFPHLPPQAHLDVHSTSTLDPASLDSPLPDFKNKLGASY